VEVQAVVAQLIGLGSSSSSSSSNKSDKPTKNEYSEVKIKNAMKGRISFIENNNSVDILY
jgi:hypothetical protein